MTEREVRTTVERVARTSSGRLLALLAARDHDIAGAEDALADAFERALTAWSRDGVPGNPEGWVLTVARNRRRDLLGGAAHRLSVPLEAGGGAGHGVDAGLDDPDGIPDKRLELLFACAHPAVDAGVRAPLLLQVVLGFETARLATAFAIPAATLAQRLVRAKRRIRTTGIPFSIPDRSSLPDRLPAVLEAVYACHALTRTERDPVAGLAGEALHLARMLTTLLPEEPEVLALAALLTYSSARRGYHRDDRFVPVSEQDPARWDAAAIEAAGALLRRASEQRVLRQAQIGRFELESAIESVHMRQIDGGPPDVDALDMLYSALLRVAPSLGARVAHAQVVGRRDGAAVGLTALELIDDPRLERFQPAWALRAALLTETGDVDGARAAYDRALALTTDAVVRDWVAKRRSALPG